MHKYYFLMFCLAVSHISCAQKAHEHPHTQSASFDKMLTTLIHFSVPTIGVKELEKNLKNYTILDAREQKEFEVSHIPTAQNIGYDNFSIQHLNHLDKNTPIVIYCSVGYRSEKIGEKLLAAGFKNVKNLYGSIFEWVNEDFNIVNAENQTTNKLHVYSKTWSIWVRNKKIEKIF